MGTKPLDIALHLPLTSLRSPSTQNGNGNGNASEGQAAERGEPCQEQANITLWKYSSAFFLFQGSKKQQHRVYEPGAPQASPASPSLLRPSTDRPQAQERRLCSPQLRPRATESSEPDTKPPPPLKKQLKVPYNDPEPLTTQLCETSRRLPNSASSG